MSQILHFRDQIATLKVWGAEVLAHKEEALEREVLEVLSLGVSIHQELLQADSDSPFAGLSPYYMQALEILNPLMGTLLVLPPEHAAKVSPQGIPWGIHTSEIYERGILPWSQTLGIPPVKLWYSFRVPGEPPNCLLLPDGSWNSNASLEDLAQAGLYQDTTRGTL